MNKLDNLDEIDKFLERYKLNIDSRRIQVNLSRPVPSKKIESLIFKNSHSSASEFSGCTGEFYHTFKE